MPHDTPFKHPPSASAREKPEHRQALATSPFHATELKPSPIDTDITASCTCCSPPRRFVGTAGRTPKEWLARHVERAAIDREQVNARRRASYIKQKAKATLNE
jgi:hypothetical protein